MIICLLGISYSGKTTLSEKLVQRYKWKHLKVVTTRLPRKNKEPDRKCVSTVEFKKLMKDDKFALCYRWVDNYYYGILKEDLVKAKKGVWVNNIIYNPTRLVRVMKPEIILLDPSREVTLKRFMSDKRYSEDMFVKRVHSLNEYKGSVSKIKYILDTSTDIETTFEKLVKLIEDNRIVSKA